MWRKEVDRLRHLIKHNKVQEALETLHCLFYGTVHDITIYLLEAAFNRAESNRQLGVITMEDYEVRMTQILRSLLELSKQMNDELALGIQQNILLGLQQYDCLSTVDTDWRSSKFRESFQQLDRYRASFFIPNQAIAVLVWMFENGVGTVVDKEIAVSLLRKKE